ncbi:MAG: hypothetical protein CTY28_14575 [Hyphomicrobium sp.]|nr:MAG: hypothetical protein CTY28_14575 [Hyphomicrobium sp.]
MNAANDDFEGPLPVRDVRAEARTMLKRGRAILSKAGDTLGELAVPIAFAIMLAAAGFHQP